MYKCMFMCVLLYQNVADRISKRYVDKLKEALKCVRGTNMQSPSDLSPTELTNLSPSEGWNLCMCQHT